MANRDLGLDTVSCTEAAAATEPPCLPSTPNREQEAQEALCHTCQSHEDVFDIPDVTSYSAAGN